MIFTLNKKLLYLISIVTIFSLLVGCSSKKETSTEPRLLNVKPGKSIQDVLDDSNPGDVILIDTGTYTGDIVVSTPDITIRGKNRNEVIIDGKNKQDNGIVVAANGVRIENLTVKSFKTNGILFQGGYEGSEDSAQTPDILDRYKLQYVNVVSNGLYGIYAFSAKNGDINNTFTYANADAGIYIGQCKPCKTVIYQNVAEANGIGIQGANASQELYVYSNDFSNNRTGVHFLSEAKEKKGPQESVLIVANTASNNNNENAPTATPDLFGFGIVIAGGNENVIERNSTTNNDLIGLALVENHSYLPSDNIFRENLSRDNGVPFGFDIGYIISGRPDVMSMGNCFENNTFSSSSIDKIETVLTCENATPGPFASQPLKSFEIPDAPIYRDVVIPDLNFPNSPNELTMIPAKLKKTAKPDLSGLTVPNEN